MYSCFIKDVSLCSGRWLGQKLTTGPETERKCQWGTRSQADTYSIHTSGLRDLCGRKSRERTNARGLQGLVRNSAFWTWGNRGSHEPGAAAAVAACTRPAQNQPVHMIAWGEKELLGYGLLMTSGEGESVFCKTMVLCKSSMFQWMIPSTWVHGPHKFDLTVVFFLTWSSR